MNLVFQGVGFHDVINPSIPVVGRADIEVEEFLLPRVIVWNPRVAFLELVNGDLQFCRSCGSALDYTSWNDGSTKQKQPRTLHDMGDFVLLDSVVYILE